MNRKERRAAAKTRPADPTLQASIAAAFAQAARHHDAGEFPAAENTCRAILTREPKHAGCLHMLGSMAQQARRFEEAVTCFQALASVKPDVAVAHHGLGSALAALGRFDEAAAAFERALAIKPANPAAAMPSEAITALNLGYLYERSSKPERAISLYERALAAKPDFAEAHNNLGVLLLALGRLKEASAVFARALALAPELFSSFADVKAVLFKILPGFDDAVRRIGAAWPARPAADEIAASFASAGIAGDPILRFVLQSTPIADIDIERFLTCARAAILETAANGISGADDDLVAFGCALAQQCFINEYVYCDTPQELEQAERLRQRLIAAVDEKSTVAALWLAAVGSYGPLGALPNARLLSERTWAEPVEALVTRQIREPHEEQRLRETMPRLTPVSGEASARVREQYEDNPYPRWVVAPAPPAAMTINQFLAMQFPGAEFRPIDDRNGPDILIAGCGTGHHPIEMARRYAASRVFAIDLSLASLSYALRKTRELGVRNIEYGQADIMSLDSLGRMFDMVDASGVLHHLADPMEGWRRLYELMRPGGVMRVGIYSEVGRSQVVAARGFIAERGFEPNPADIRRARQELLDTPMRSLASAQDFYCISECRDLLFHAEEHRLSLPQIKDFLVTQKARLIGFEVGPAIRQAYRERNPGDPGMVDIDRWHAFELDRPSTFAGMYQFWCQKC